MKVKELIEKLNKLNPELECYTIDYSAEWQTIDDAWLEQANQKKYCLFGNVLVARRYE